MLEAVTPKATPEINEQLDKMFTPKEVAEALAQMHPLKAPGPDGTHAFFYSKFWSIVRNNVLGVVLNILNNGASPQELNHTYITLIPKKKCP